MYLDYYIKEDVIWSYEEEERLELQALIHDLASPLHIDVADICSLITSAHEAVLTEELEWMRCICGRLYITQLM